MKMSGMKVLAVILLVAAIGFAVWAVSGRICTGSVWISRFGGSLCTDSQTGIRRKKRRG